MPFLNIYYDAVTKQLYKCKYIDVLELGSIIEAHVYRVEPYGVFLRHNDAELFVHLQELSWTDRRPANARGLLNSFLRVQVLSRDPEKDQWIASVKRIHPESNPFREVADLPVGVVLRGKVIYETSGAFFVRLHNGAEGIIIRSEVKCEIRAGDNVDAIVVAVDAEKGKLQLRLKT